MQEMIKEMSLSNTILSEQNKNIVELMNMKDIENHCKEIGGLYL